MHRNVNSELILHRYCSHSDAHSTDARVKVDSSSAVTAVKVQHIYVTFSPSPIIGTSDAMVHLLEQRTTRAAVNAEYIDEEMYAMTISNMGVVRIRVHSPSTTSPTTTTTPTSSSSHRGVANALASLDQLLHQVVPLQLPLSMIDWPDNHWRGKIHISTLCSQE